MLMLPVVSALLAQATPTPPPPQEVLRVQEVRPLPGQLNTIPMFNSNSPELVTQEGILLSTFPPAQKQYPAAHLNFAFRDRFDVFVHHVAKAPKPDDLRSLYIGVIAYNPGPQPVTIDLLQAASYLSQPDAPFNDLPPQVENPSGEVYAGPGSRATDTILRGQRQTGWPDQIVIPPGQSQMLMNLPIPVKTLTPPLNGRSTILRLRSSGPVYLASLAKFATPNPDGTETAPNLADWQTLLTSGELSTPRDRTPTPPTQSSGTIIYGRVAGVALGSAWKAYLSDRPGSFNLTIPDLGQTFSYGLSLLRGGTMGTQQVQSSPMVRRYPDTAYEAHGNYALEYNLTLPLRNPSSEPRQVVIQLDTALKQDKIGQGLKFFDPPARQVFFRGTLRIRYPNDQGLPQTTYWHLVQRRGQQGEPLAKFTIPPLTNRLVQVDLLYPPDSTPPQVLTVHTVPN